MFWLIENGKVVPYSCFGSLREGDQPWLPYLGVTILAPLLRT